MQRTKQNHAWRVFRLLLIFFCIGLSLQFTSCGKKQAENTVFTVDDLSGKKIGVQLGTTGDTLVSDYETDGSNTTVERFNKGNDAIQALKQGKIDAVVIDAQPAQSFVAANSDLMILPEEFANEDYAIAIAKGNSSLTSSINDALNTLKANGTLDAILNNYIGENIGQTPYTSPENVNRSNGTLVMATNAYFQPYEYYENGTIVGIDVDVATAICDTLGMTLKVEDMEFDSIITAVSSGKADVGIAGMTVTPERQKNIDFSDSYTTSQQVIVVRNNDAVSGGTSLSEKFKTDFLTDNRYQFILTGLKNTLIIAACAALIGIVIGFLVAVVRSSHDKTGNLKILNAICTVYLTIIRGTPSMVQLLIIYYIIFGSMNISKLLVAILAFGINSGAYVAEIFRSGIMSIDNGQFEAARSLGLTYRQTMLSVILPQAFKNIIPEMANTFLTNLKMTSVLNVIAVQELFMAAKTVGGNYYKYFESYLVIAVIYFVLCFVFDKIFKFIEKKMQGKTDYALAIEYMDNQ